MSNKVFIITGVLVLLFLFSNQSAYAQTDEHKFEVGAHFTVINLTDFRQRVLPGFQSGDATIKGIGGRIGYNFMENFALDAEGNFFPETAFGNDEIGQKTQGFIGLKAGTRSKRIGIFAKARPGVMWFGEFSSRGDCRRTSFGSVCGVSHQKDFALDLGGIIELYPSKRTIVRLDLGDTIVRFKEENSGTFINPITVPADTTHNFQASIGFGYRF